MKCEEYVYAMSPARGQLVHGPLDLESSAQVNCASHSKIKAILNLQKHRLLFGGVLQLS